MTGIADTGGQAKYLVKELDITVNGEPEDRRGRKLYPGDIGYDAGHVWMIVGQCKDKSCVVLHSIPQAGVQLSGTPTPAGNYDSQAVQLCNRYMSIYPGFTRFPYETSCGNYVTRSNYFRWYRSTLADPEGFMTKNANQVLSSLFS